MYSDLISKSHNQNNRKWSVEIKYNKNFGVFCDIGQIQYVCYKYVYMNGHIYIFSTL